MSEQIKCQNQPIPAYSGITINIMNPTLNAAPMGGYREDSNLNAVGINVLPQEQRISEENREQKYITNPQHEISPNGYYSRAEIAQNQREGKYFASQETDSEHSHENKYLASRENESEYSKHDRETLSNTENTRANPVKEKETVKETIIYNNDMKEQQTAQMQENKTADKQNELPQNYPAEYYINDYKDTAQEKASTEGNGTVINNYYANKENPDSQEVNEDTSKSSDAGYKSQETAQDVEENKGTNLTQIPDSDSKQEKAPDEYGLNNDIAKNQPQNPDNIARNDIEENDLTTSQQIIEMVDAENAKEKALRENGKKTKVVALTNEYIMSLENYLNNPNTDIRLMAAKDILTRLDEDKDRYDDAALNALLNKMLQDPSKLVRIAALSALSSDLASGNDYTVELLNQIQQNPNSDQQDVLEAAQIMLNRSAKTEIRYIPIENNEQQAEE